jgi:hypothetical protein
LTSATKPPIKMSTDDVFDFGYGYTCGCEAGYSMLDSGMLDRYGHNTKGRVPTWYDRGFAKGIQDSLKGEDRSWSDEPLKETLALMDAKGFDGRTAVLYTEAGMVTPVKPVEGTLWTYSDAVHHLERNDVKFIRVRDLVMAWTGQGIENVKAGILTAPITPMGSVILIPADQIK